MAERVGHVRRLLRNDHRRTDKPANIVDAGQAAAVNRLGTGPWSGPVNVTPQAPYSAPPAPTGDADLRLGTLALHWTTTGSDNALDDSCIGPKSFYIIWDGPDGRERRADEWAAHINAYGSAGEVNYTFRESPGSTGYYEMNGK